MKQLFLLSLFCTTFFVSCSPVYVISKTDYDKIPIGSKQVIVTVNYSADSLLKNVVDVLQSKGWVLDISTIGLQVSSPGRSIGSGTMLKPTVYIKQYGDSAKASFRGEWGLDAEGQVGSQVYTHSANYSTSEVKFDGTATTKPDIAFQKLVSFAKLIPNGIITYRK